MIAHAPGLFDFLHLNPAKVHGPSPAAHRWDDGPNLAARPAPAAHPVRIGTPGAPAVHDLFTGRAGSHRPVRMPDNVAITIQTQPAWSMTSYSGFTYHPSPGGNETSRTFFTSQSASTLARLVTRSWPGMTNVLEHMIIATPCRNIPYEY